MPLKLSSEPIFQLRIPGRLPSWNAILAMGHWERAKFKKRIQAEFLSALKASGIDCSMKITSPKRPTSIVSGTRASSKTTTRLKRKLKRLKGKLRRGRKST